MIRCSSCQQTHWVYARAGKSSFFEWLTGLTPYRCLACSRRGWHRSHPTSLALETMGRATAVVIRDRRAVAVLTGGIVLGIGTGAAVLRSGTAGADADRETQIIATPPAPQTITTAAAEVLATEPRLSAELPSPSVQRTEDRGPAATPTTGDVRPAVTSTNGDVRPAAASPAAVTPVAPPAVTPVAPPVTPVKPVKVVAQAAPPRAPDRQKAQAPKPPVRQQPQSTVRPAIARQRTVRAPPLPKFHGTLAVRSEPRGALVSVDGRVVGSTPLRLKAVPAGSRVIRIESEGYERWSSAARVVANQETSIVATLQRGSSQ